MCRIKLDLITVTDLLRQELEKIRQIELVVEKFHNVASR